MRTIKWGVLGTADIALSSTIPGMIEADNCALYAVAGRDAEKARRFQMRFGFEKYYDNYEALLRDPAVEAVYIPLPNSLHCEWTLKALEAGKHVLCEKPLAPTVGEMEAMFRAAEENHVLLMEAFAYLHSPLTAAIRAEVESGALGRIVYMESEFVTSDYDPANIRMRRETCGGSVYDLGCYCTSQILWMLGEEPESVRAVARYNAHGVDTLATAVLGFGSGAQAQLTCGMTLATEQGRRVDRCEIHGTRGSLRTTAEFNQSGMLAYTVTVDGRAAYKTVRTPQNYRLEIEQFGRCVAGEAQPLVSRDFSLKNARLIERILGEIGYGRITL